VLQRIHRMLSIYEIGCSTFDFYLQWRDVKAREVGKATKDTFRICVYLKGAPLSFACCCCTYFSPFTQNKTYTKEFLEYNKSRIVADGSQSLPRTSKLAAGSQVAEIHFKDNNRSHVSLHLCALWAECMNTRRTGISVRASHLRDEATLPMRFLIVVCTVSSDVGACFTWTPDSTSLNIITNNIVSNVNIWGHAVT
jgi:hypothetical protein